MKVISKLFAVAILILVLTAAMSACARKVESVTIAGEENIELSYGESVTFEATVSPEEAKNKNISWSVIETNLGGEYVFDGSSFTAKRTAGYAVIEVTSENGKTDRVTIVINPELEKAEEPDNVKVTFYAVDGITVVDVCYIEKNSKITPPDYDLSDSGMFWVDETGNTVDFSSLTVTEDSVFTAKLPEKLVYYTVTYWYYNDSGDAVQQGNTYSLVVGSGSAVPAEDVSAIEEAVEGATGKTVINWTPVISDDGLNISWYAELK